jgi:DnaJ-class molecular chaperone
VVAEIAVLMVATASVAGAADYIGAAKCKMCHKLQFDSWATLKHATAFEALKPEEQADAKCLKCHATGGKADLPGVQCEACHGPGSGYKAMDVMKSREASVAAGLIIPDEALCKTCHVGAPHDQKPFDYKTALAAGVHKHKTQP